MKIAFHEIIIDLLDRCILYLIDLFRQPENCKACFIMVYWL